MDGAGALVVRTAAGELREEGLRIYQEVGGVRSAVPGKFRAGDDRVVSFEIGPYDHSRPLIIDPVISFSTYLGGSGMDAATGIAVDPSGNIYVAGWTEAPGPPLENALQPVFGGSVDAFVAKFDSSGSNLLYCTFLGGSGDDRAFAIAVDASGSAYVTGWTYSTDFPTAGSPAQASLAGARDAFVAKLSPAGDSLVYSTYVGGSNSEAGRGISLDSAGNAYIAGETTSSNLPMLYPVQSSLKGAQNAFVAAVDGSGKLLFCTYLGGSGTDGATAIATDSTGGIYVTGSTTSTDFPTFNSLQPANAGFQDAFVAKFNPGGASLAYSTYLGGSNGTVIYPESGLGIDVDNGGNAYVAGVTSSPDFPLWKAYQAALSGALDAFIAKLNPSGTALVFSTFLGGSSVDYAYGIRVNSYGGVCVAGYTASSDFPLFAPVQSAIAGQFDAFAACLNAPGSGLSASTYLGGSKSDSANALALDSTSAYMAGQTLSTDFPAVNAFQNNNEGPQNAFVVKIAQFPPPPPSAPVLTSPADNSASIDVSPTLAWNASPGADSYQVDFGSSNPPPLATSTDGTSYAPGTLNPGTTYYWQVLANNATGSTPSALASFTVACTYALNPPSSSAGFSGAAATVTVTAPPACAWTAVGNASWLTITSGGAGSGNGAVGYSVAANPNTSPRTGTLTIAGQNFTITEAAAPQLTIAKTHTGGFTQGQNGAMYTITVANSSGTGPTGGPVTVSEAVPAGLMLVSMAGTGWTCATGSNACTRGDALAAKASYPAITVTVNVAWNAPAQVTNQASVSGGGSATAAASDPTAIAAACPYTISPTSASAGAASGNGSVTVTAPAGCAWTAASNASWLPLSGSAAGSGTGSVAYSVAANAGALRGGTLTVAGQTVTITQAAAGAPGWPSITSLTPYSGTGLSQTFTAVFSDPDGWADISLAYFMVNVVQSPSDACYVKYDASANALWLIANDAVSWLGPIAPGSGALQNAACTLNGAASSVSGSGNNLTVNYAVTFVSNYVGQRGIYLSVANFEGNVLDWSPYGAWWPTLTSGTPVNWYRLYVPFNSSHHYTADYNEYTTLGSEGYVEEGAIGQLYNGPFGTAVPFYRIYIIPAATHFWTTDRNEYLTLILYRGYYAGEGIAGFLLATATNGALPYYRLLYCCATPPIHFWTTDSNENAVLQGEGWISEGIPGYMLPAGPLPSADDVPMVVAPPAGRAYQTRFLR